MLELLSQQKAGVVFINSDYSNNQNSHHIGIINKDEAAINQLQQSLALVQMQLKEMMKRLENLEQSFLGKT